MKTEKNAAIEVAGGRSVSDELLICDADVAGRLQFVQKSTKNIRACIYSEDVV